MTLDLGVLVSGSGSNLQAIIDRIESGALDARIRLVISNIPGVFGLERAEKHGIPTAFLDHRAYADRQSFDLAMVEALLAHGVRVVALAGFMRIVTPIFLDAFPAGVLNIHPALLPSFPGVHGQADAVRYGVRVSGCTVHFVDSKVDHGPIIIQAAVPVRPEDDTQSLGARILAFEHRIFPQALSWLAQGRLAVRERKVHLASGRTVPAGDEHASTGLVSPPLEVGF